MSRRQARIDREVEKELKAKQKSARLVKGFESQQRPRSEYEPSPRKIAGHTINPDSFMQMRMEYRLLDAADRDGSWSWGEHRDWCDPDIGSNNACIVRSTMISMSGLYWHEIIAQTTGSRRRRKKHHSHSFSDIDDEAQTRWLEIGRLEDELFRFRTGGQERIWGFRTGHTFWVVWWDAKHRIYPID